MQRGDVAVVSISAALAAVVAAAIAFSVLVLDRESSVMVSTTDSSYLVVTWGASFCAVEPTNQVCRSGDVDRLGPTLILHGLWPEPSDNQYCGLSPELAEVARRGHGELPPLELSDAVQTGLQSTMAGWKTLAPHEWYTHGTCSNVTPNHYFGDAVELTRQVGEVLDPVFKAAEGGRLSVDTVRARIDERFGAGTGERVGLACRHKTGERTMVVDVQLSLPAIAAMGVTGEPPNLGELLSQARPITTACHEAAVG